MSDISITAANVKVGGSSAVVKRVQYGETITQGNALYLKSDGKWWKADCNLSVEASMSAGGGEALTPGVANDYGYVVTEGLINIGATLTAGEIYVLSANAGGIAPEADLASGWNVVIVGVAKTTALLNVKNWYSGATV